MHDSRLTCIGCIPNHAPLSNPVPGNTFLATVVSRDHCAKLRILDNGHRNGVSAEEYRFTKSSARTNQVRNGTEVIRFNETDIFNATNLAIILGRWVRVLVPGFPTRVRDPPALRTSRNDSNVIIALICWNTKSSEHVISDFLNMVHIQVCKRRSRSHTSCSELN